ncbi:MAG: amidohydrolase [Hyphomonadaceae bacterium]|nr:amidohydrolase [Hyphomonadaceae bacterium]
MTGTLAAGSAAAIAPFLPRMAAAQAKPHRIDVHHHLSPPTHIEALRTAKLGSPPTYNWSVAKSIEDMDKAGVATSITSVTTPAVSFLDSDNARRVARECNEYAAKLMADHPGRFGIFATLPLPHVDVALQEIAFALDTLKADGICLMTNYGDKWLGTPDFAPVMAELNRRKAVVYTHPGAANCCRNLVPDIPDQIIEFGTDTTRTIANLVFSGTTTANPDIRFIFSHAGGTMPFLVERLQLLPSISPKLKPNWTFDKVTTELTRYHYDTAQAAHPGALTSLMKLVPVSQVVFGTDFPFRTSADHVKGLTAYFSAADLKAIDRDNAVKLMPRLQA